MIIKAGYDNKPTEIKIRSGTNKLELWITQNGTEGLRRDSRGRIFVTDNKETLAYMTFDEAFELFKELRAAVIEAFSINGRDL